jgi:hypothetical protein
MDERVVLGMDERAGAASNEVIDWLRPETELDLPQQPVGFEPPLRESGIRAALQLRDRAIVAIAAVRAVRRPRALETIAQEDFVVMFASAIPGHADAVPALAGSGPTERGRRHTAST